MKVVFDLKSNNKSVRLDDRIYNYVIKYRGDGFNQKFENIVIDFFESENDRKKRINDLDILISKRENEINSLNDKLHKMLDMSIKINAVVSKLDAIVNSKGV